MNKRTLGLVGAAMLGGLSFSVGTSSAAPLAVPGIQGDQSLATPVQMTRSERMMQRRMMERRMMRRQMMKRRMMNRM